MIDDAPTTAIAQRQHQQWTAQQQWQWKTQWCQDSNKGNGWCDGDDDSVTIFAAMALAAEAATMALQQIVGRNEAAIVKGNCNEMDANGVIVQNADIAHKGCNL